MSDLGDLLIQYLTMSGNANAAPPDNPSYGAQQMGSQGVLGQGLLNQRQQMEQVESGQRMPPPAPSSSSGSPAAAPPVQSGQAMQEGVRPWAFSHLNYDDLNQAEKELLARTSGIPLQHHNYLMTILQSILRASAPPATAEGTQPGIPQI